MSDELFTELCTLLDAIELALTEDARPVIAAQRLVEGRFDIMRRHGITVEFGGIRRNRRDGNAMNKAPKTIQDVAAIESIGETRH